MNSNKVLIIVSCFLTALVVLSAIAGSRNNKHGLTTTDNELFMTNVQCIPDIIKSFESAKNTYPEKNILFVRYSKSSCTPCNDSFLTELLLFQEEIGKENVWIFPAYPDNRNARIQLEADLAKFNYRNIPRDSLLIPFYGGEEKSYFAWIDKEGEIGMVFLPDKDNAAQTRQYFQEIKKLLLGK